MSCCDKPNSSDQVYVPLNRRLIAFANESTDSDYLAMYPRTKLYIFMFADLINPCVECRDKFTALVDWFTKYNLLHDPVNNVKLIIEHEMDKNLICVDLGLANSPTFMICDPDGNVMDMLSGYPSQEWLEKYILPLVRG